MASNKAALVSLLLARSHRVGERYSSLGPSLELWRWRQHAQDDTNSEEPDPGAEPSLYSFEYLSDAAAVSGSNHAGAARCNRALPERGVAASLISLLTSAASVRHRATFLARTCTL